MNFWKRIFALGLVLMLLVVSAACLVPEEETETTDPSTETDVSSDAEASEFDPDAIAIELGDVQITAGEIADTYNYYIEMLANYYGGSVPTDEASIREYVGIAVQDLVYYNLPAWQAGVQGIALSEEELSELQASIQAEIDYIRTDYICYYANAYAGAADYYDDLSKLTDEEIDGALAQINLELGDYFGEGYDFDTYLADQYESMYQDAVTNALSEKLRADSDATVTVTDAQIAEWKETTLAAQQEAFAETPLAYRELADLFRDGQSTEPVLFVPEGFAYVQVMRFAPEGDLPAEYTANQTEMKTLEAEYGALLLNGENAERQAEIIARYAELKNANAALEATYSGAQKTLADEIHQQLAAGGDFTALLKANNSAGLPDLYIEEGELIYLNGDTAFPTVITDALQELSEGEFSAVLFADHTYYIVKLLRHAAPGPVDTTSLEDAIHSAVLYQAQETAWTELLKAWETEAHSVAVFHEETYASVGY